MKERSYIIKLFDKNNNFKKTLNADDNVADIFFSTQLGLGNTQATLKKTTKNEYFALGDLIRIYVSVYDRDAGTKPLSDKIIFAGEICEIKTVYEKGMYYYSISAFGLPILLNYIYYGRMSDAWDGFLNGLLYNENPALGIKSIIDRFNSKTGTNYFYYTPSSIQDYTSSVTVDLRKKKCREAIEEILNVSEGYIFTIDPDGLVKFIPNATQTHVLTLGLNVTRLSDTLKKTELANRVIVEYTDSSLHTYQEDAASITQYRLHETYQQNNESGTQATADKFGQTYLTNHSNPQKDIEIEVNGEYLIENISVGDKVTVVNYDGDISERRIEKIDYKGNYAVLYIENYKSIEKAFAK